MRLASICFPPCHLSQLPSSARFPALLFILPQILSSDWYTPGSFHLPAVGLFSPLVFCTPACVISASMSNSYFCPPLPEGCLLKGCFSYLHQLLFFSCLLAANSLLGAAFSMKQFPPRPARTFFPPEVRLAMSPLPPSRYPPSPFPCRVSLWED